MLVPSWRESVASRTSNIVSQTSVQKLCVARPGTFSKEGRPQARAASVAHRGDSRFRLGKVNWRFAPTKCKFCWAARFGRACGFRNFVRIFDCDKNVSWRDSGAQGRWRVFIRMSLGGRAS